MFRMFEKRESETENKSALKNRIMADKAPCGWRIQGSSNHGKVVMFWLNKKNLVKLEITIYIREYSKQVFLQCFKIFSD